MKKVKMVYIEWMDAYSNSGWFSYDRFKSHFLDPANDVYVNSCGFLLRRTKKCVIFAGTWQPSRGGCVDEQFCDIHKIPNTWIRKFKVLGYSKEAECPKSR